MREIIHNFRKNLENLTEWTVCDMRGSLSKKYFTNWNLLSAILSNAFF